MNHHRLSFLILPVLGGAVAALLLNPQSAAAGFDSGLALCLHSVMPAMFPFMVLCNLLAACPQSAVLGLPLRPLTAFCGLRARQAPLTLLLSWLGGYAVCAQCIANYRRLGRLTQSEATLLLLLGCCSGPGFVIGCVGGLLLGSVRLGLLLYGLQLAANFLSAACLWPFLRRGFSEAGCTSTKHEPPRAEAIPDGGISAAISDAVTASLSICGCILFFRVLCAVLLSFLPQGVPLLAPLCSSVFEISAGCADFAALRGPVGLQGVAACLSLLGLSVLAQLKTLLKDALPQAIPPLLISRLVHVFWMQALVRLCLHFVPGETAVFSSLAPRLVVKSRAAPDAVLGLFCLACVVLYKARKNLYTVYHQM